MGDVVQAASWSRAVAWPRIARSPRIIGALRFLGALAVALMGFAIVLILQGRNPAEAYAGLFASTLGTSFGRSEVVVKAIPLMLCGLAVTLPARVGLVNVGGEGQLYAGALLASWAALTIVGLPAIVMLPLMVLLAMLGGALWAAVPAFLRARGWLNETISTLLLNYVATLLIQFFVFGPWKDPQSANFPQSRLFPDAARLPSFAGERIHAGIFLALIAVGVLAFLLSQTRWGLEMRSIGGNPEAARRAGVPIAKYIIVTLMLGGALAGIAGLGEVSAIQGRLRPDFSPGYGFIGFLVSWLAGHNPLTVVVMSLLLGVLTAGGDSLQISQHLPFASVNLLMALTLAAVLVQRGKPATLR
jgi:simple sugar transport system permease protein